MTLSKPSNANQKGTTMSDPSETETAAPLNNRYARARATRLRNQADAQAPFIAAAHARVVARREAEARAAAEADVSDTSDADRKLIIAALTTHAEARARRARELRVPKAPGQAIASDLELADRFAAEADAAYALRERLA